MVVDRVARPMVRVKIGARNKIHDALNTADAVGFNALPSKRLAALYQNWKWTR